MNGILNVLKPSDMSSQQVIHALKRIMFVRKAGHGGTLDPAAAGVLPLFLGYATRLAEYAMDGDKEYIAQVQFGISTDTQDAQGKVVATSDRVIEYAEMQSLIDSIPAVIWQQPPAYSAIKINGRKMVNLARKGITCEIPRRQVYIHDKELVCQLSQNAYLIRIRCSKGTYIRTICHDLGIETGAYAHCSFLLRTKSGPFLLRDAVTLEQISQAVQRGTIADLVLPMGLAVMHLDRIVLDDEEYKAISVGQAIAEKIPEQQPDRKRICALWYRDEFVGIGTHAGAIIKPKKVFCGERDI